MKLSRLLREQRDSARMSALGAHPHRTRRVYDEPGTPVIHQVSAPDPDAYREFMSDIPGTVVESWQTEGFVQAMLEPRHEVDPDIQKPPDT